MSLPNDYENIFFGTSHLFKSKSHIAWIRSLNELHDLDYNDTEQKNTKKNCEHQWATRIFFKSSVINWLSMDLHIFIAKLWNFSTYFEFHIDIMMEMVRLTQANWMRKIRSSIGLADGLSSIFIVWKYFFAVANWFDHKKTVRKKMINIDCSL